jgi:hypothetical protein
MSDTAPTWTLIALALLWVVFLATFPGTETLASAGSGLAAVSGLAALASIPLLYLDARAAARAGDLEARPVLVVVAVFLLYLLTLPVYIAFRLYRQRQTDAEPPAAT